MHRCLIRIAAQDTIERTPQNCNKSSLPPLQEMMDWYNVKTGWFKKQLYQPLEYTKYDFPIRPQMFEGLMIPQLRDSRKKILVTGGAGFLGSHLIDRLMDQGHEVICADSLFTGSLSNIKHYISDPRFTFLQHDITNPLYVEVDEIYNFACPASPIYYQHDPIHTMKTSVIGALNMLGLAKRLGCKIFQASTSEVYGDPLVHPQVESYWGNVNPIGIRSCYDEGKRCAETLFFDYWRQHKTEIKVARIFNTYGPRMQPSDGRVVSNFIVQALRGDPITIYGDGQQTRSFCFVDDLIDGILSLMTTDASVTGPVNIGNPSEFTMRELAQKILFLTKSNSRIATLAEPSDDPRQRKPDTAFAKSTLAWESKVQLEQGLVETIEYFKIRLQRDATSR